MQREPTVNLNELYNGKGDPSVVSDFDLLQRLLSDPAASAGYLEVLNSGLAEELESRKIAQDAPPAELAAVANEVLDKVLRTYEIKCGFTGELAVLVGFASADDFIALTKGKQHFQDVGAGAPHGEYTHRIQWFIAMGAITGRKFDGTPTLSNLRTAQMNGHAASRDFMTTWFEVAKELGLAKGKDPIEGKPTYFERNLIPDLATQETLSGFKANIVELLASLGRWTTSAAGAVARHQNSKLSRMRGLGSIKLTDVNFATLQALQKEVIRQWTAVSTLGPGTLAPAMVAAWFNALHSALAIATADIGRKAHKGSVDPAAVSDQTTLLNEVPSKLIGTPSWKVVN